MATGGPDQLFVENKTIFPEFYAMIAESWSGTIPPRSLNIAITIGQNISIFSSPQKWDEIYVNCLTATFLSATNRSVQSYIIFQILE